MNERVTGHSHAATQVPARPQTPPATLPVDTGTSASRPAVDGVAYFLVKRRVIVRDSTIQEPADRRLDIGRRPGTK